TTSAARSASSMVQYGPGSTRERSITRVPDAGNIPAMVKGAPMSLVLLVRLKAKAGQEERVADLMRELATETRKEPGCELYIACRDPEDPASFMFFEQYRDQTAFEEHGASEHLQRIAVAQLFELVD